jgi:insulysin
MKNIDRDYLIQWFRTHYAANKMNLVVVGKEPSQELERLVMESFIPIQSVTSAFEVPSQSVFPDLPGKLVWVDPIKDSKTLNLVWEIPNSFVHMETKAGSIVSHLVGHEGRNSILAQLKELEWAESLSAGSYVLGFENCMFEVSVTLTTRGLEALNGVIELVRSSLDILQRKNIPNVSIFFT